MTGCVIRTRHRTLTTGPGAKRLKAPNWKDVAKSDFHFDFSINHDPIICRVLYISHPWAIEPLGFHAIESMKSVHI